MKFFTNLVIDTPRFGEVGYTTLTMSKEALDLLPDPRSDFDLSLSEFISAEMSIETIGFFTPSLNRLKIKSKTKHIEYQFDGKKIATSIKIVPNIDLGLPITTDFDYYRAFQWLLEMHLKTGGKLDDPIRVPTRSIIGLAQVGRKDKAQEQNKKLEIYKSDRLRVKDWLRRLRGTRIDGTIYYQKQPIEIVGGVFDQIITTGRTLPSGIIADTNYVWLSEFYKNSLRRGYVRPVDLELHTFLKTAIAKSLYPLLETGWHATGHKTFKKSYQALCEEFLLKQRAKPSDIKRHFDPPLQELKAAKYLQSWSYTESKSNTRDWIIHFRPGKRFFASQEHREEKKSQWRDIEAKKAKGKKQSQKLTPEQEYLLQDVVDFCGEKDDPIAMNGYRKAVLTHPESIIRTAISEGKLAARQGTIKKNRGAFFFDSINFHIRARGTVEA